MTKVVIDMSMSLDGFVAGPDDGRADPLGRHGGMHLFGRRTYEIADGWRGRHPVEGMPVFVLTHDPPPDFPHGPSNLTFVTDGIESAIDQARAVAGDKDIKLGGTREPRST